jgi:dephospho-CoA kinase
MATQLSRSERLAHAHDVIDNSGTPAALKPQVERLDRRYRDLAATTENPS